MALKSKFAKDNKAFKANKIFTDRVEPRAAFADSIAKVIAAKEDDSRQILSFYGKGGIGKTSLLKQIIAGSEKNVYEKYPRLKFHNIYISLEAYDYANPLNVLTALRSRIHGDGSLFDYALLQYYAKARVSVEEITHKNTFLSSGLMDVLNEVMDICSASASIPMTIVEKGIDLIKDIHLKSKYKEELRELALLDEFEIFERLPYYLGLCISHSAGKGVVHALFFDSYESMRARTEGTVSSVDSAQWLKELFLSCNRTLFVIGTRDRLDWEKQDADWGAYLDQHLLSNLSDEDCRWFLEQVPVADASGQPNRKVIEDVIRHAGGVPLYLDLCVDLYEHEINAGREPDFSDFHGSNAIIDRYMRHMKEKDQYSVSVLSLLNSFDSDFAIKLLEKQNLIYHQQELLRLLEKSVFLPLDEGGALYKVDESVRSHIYELMLPKWRITLLQNILEVILENRDGRLYPYLSSVLDMLFREPSYIETVKDQFYEALEYFSSIGYWNELRFVFRGFAEKDIPALRGPAVFTELMWLRRTGNLAEAARFAEAAPLTREALGVWYYMYRFFVTHVSHLLGDYDNSICRYRELLKEMDLEKGSVPKHIYNTVAIKYIDLLFLKGHFGEAMERVEQLLENPATILPDAIELLRIKGHILRFQRQYREAEIVYRSALKQVQENGLRAFEGKLFTNLAEATCMTDPAKAMDWYKLALDKNTQVNNEIEVGKSHVAASVATTVAGDPAAAERLAKTALLVGEITGYRSGQLFAMMALAFAQKQSSQEEQMRQTLTRAKQLADEIGVYQFLFPEDLKI